MKIYNIDFGYPFHDKEKANKILAELKPLAIKGEIGLDYCLLFKINAEDWPKIAELAYKYEMNATVLREEIVK